MSKIKSFQLDISNLTKNITLNSLKDVSTQAVTEDQVLAWNSISNKWEGRNRTDVAAAWGNIIGTLSNQTDLQTVLDLKTDNVTFNTHTAGTALNHAAGDITFDDTNTNLGIGSPSSITEIQTAIEKIVSNSYYIDITTGVSSPIGMTNSVIPIGWTTTYNAIGNFTVTHNLNNSGVGFALAVIYNGTARVLNPTVVTLNSITFQITDTLDTATEGNIIGKLLF